jgi:prepilin-type N-terminal cleavage/methylation domain-containing protein
VASERGFTLVEVLVVMAVLSFGVLGVLQTTLLAARLEQRGLAISAGTFLAQEALERIAAFGWERATAGLRSARLPAELGLGGDWLQREVSRPGARFLLVYERDQVPGGQVPRCTVSCFWEGASGGYDPRHVVRLSARWRR